jgi:hypothetical protein
MGVERPGTEADYSPAASAEVKNTWSCTSSLPGIVLSEVQDKFSCLST